MVQTMNNVIMPVARNSGLAGAGFSHTMLALVLLGALAVSQASATTYNFVIPVGTQVSPDPNSLLGALSGAISRAPLGPNPAQFAFYDFYIRPEIASDAGHGLTNQPNPFVVITDYSMSASTATAPVPGCAPAPCTSTYGAAPNIIEPGPWLGAAAHFTFNPADNVIALVTINPNAGGQNYDGQASNPSTVVGARTEIMPSAATFAFTLDTSAYSSFQTPQITFQVFALAIKYISLGNTATLIAKNQSFVGNFDASGQEVPEPSTIFVAGGGLCLLALARIRRKAKP
jgi:hypothetical protein